jgi:hypothetical protein
MMSTDTSKFDTLFKSIRKSTAFTKFRSHIPREGHSYFDLPSQSSTANRFNFRENNLLDKIGASIHSSNDLSSPRNAVRKQDIDIADEEDLRNGESDKPNLAKVDVVEEQLETTQLQGGIGDADTNVCQSGFNTL